MIPEFVDAFFENKDSMIEIIKRDGHPEDYETLVRMVVSFMPKLDPDRITEINHGDWQGTLVYVIGAKGYQPYDYWYCMVSYGSCSACDTLEYIRGYSSKPVTEQQITDYMNLCLHIVQSLKEMAEGEL